MATKELFPPEGFYRIDEAYSLWMKIVHGHENLSNPEKDSTRYTFIEKMSEHHHCVCVFNDKSEKFAIPNAAWAPAHFPDLILLSPTVSKYATGPWENYRGCIVILPKAELEEWATTYLRELLFDKIANGMLTPSDGEQILKQKNLGPLLDNPSVDEFHPETEPYWTLPMSVAWLVWRDLTMVTRNWEAFTNNCHFWREIRGPKQQESGFIPEVFPKPNLPLIRIGFNLDSGMALGQALMSAPDAQREIEQRLQSGELVAVGTPPGGLPVQIPAHEWTGLDLIEHKGGDALMVKGASLQIAYEKLCIQSKAVMAIWQPPSALVAIWDFALKKCNSEKDQTGRMVTGFYASFWRGEFGDLELTLLQDRLFNHGAESQDGYSRELLAAIALGGEAFEKIGPAAALRELETWNMRDYTKIREEYRYYFVPDGGIGSMASQGRGLCAPIDLLEKWHKIHTEMEHPLVASQDAKHSKKPIESSAGERVRTEGAFLGDNLSLPTTLGKKPRFSNGKDAAIFAGVTSFLAEFPDTALETCIRETAQNLGYWPSDAELQYRLVERMKKRIRRMQE